MLIIKICQFWGWSIEGNYSIIMVEHYFSMEQVFKSNIFISEKTNGNW